MPMSEPSPIVQPCSIAWCPTVTAGAMVSGTRCVSMQNGAILDVRSGADEDAVVVAADHRPEPDRDLMLEHHIADDCGVGRHEMTVAAELHFMLAEREEHGNVVDGYVARFSRGFAHL